MSFSCCGVGQRPDDFYIINHPKKGTVKVYFANCCKCGGTILKLDVGLFGGCSEYLRGKDAKAFKKKYPQPVYKIEEKPEIKEDKQENKDTAKGFTYCIHKYSKDFTKVITENRALGTDRLINRFESELMAV